MCIVCLCCRCHELRAFSLADMLCIILSSKPFCTYSVSSSLSFFLFPLHLCGWANSDLRRMHFYLLSLLSLALFLALSPFLTPPPSLSLSLSLPMYLFLCLLSISLPLSYFLFRLSLFNRSLQSGPIQPKPSSFHSLASSQWVHASCKYELFSLSLLFLIQWRKKPPQYWSRVYENDREKSFSWSLSYSSPFPLLSSRCHLPLPFLSSSLFISFDIINQTEHQSLPPVPLMAGPISSIASFLSIPISSLPPLAISKSRIVVGILVVCYHPLTISLLSLSLSFIPSLVLLNV